MGSVAQLKHPRKFWPKVYRKVIDQTRQISFSKSTNYIFVPPDAVGHFTTLDQIPRRSESTKIIREEPYGGTQSCATIGLPLDASQYRSEM